MSGDRSQLLREHKEAFPEIRPEVTRYEGGGEGRNWKLLFRRDDVKQNNVG